LHYNNPNKMPKQEACMHIIGDGHEHGRSTVRDEDNVELTLKG